MPSRLHWSGKNNRSQHNLVGSTAAEDSPSGPASAGASAPSGAAGAGPAGAGAGAGVANQQQNPPSDSPNPAFSSSESFQHDTSAGRPNNQQQQQQAPPPPPHLINIYGNTAGSSNSSNLPPQLQHSNSVTGGAFDSRQTQREHDQYADQVTRSQSQRYPQIPPISTQPHQQQQQQQQHQHHQHQLLHRHPQHPSLGSGSVEDLSVTGGQSISSPISGPPQPLFNQQQQQQQHHHHHHHQQPPPPPQPPKKQSTRKLIKNILRGQEHPPQVPQSPYNNSSPPALARRNSKRVSLPPPAPPGIRTGLSQVSQVSLDQQQLDWQNQAPPTQPSPLQGVGGFHESYVIDGSDQELQLQNQNPHDIQQHPTIRPVPPSDSGSPYSADDVAYRQHQGHLQQHQHQGQGSHEVQHQQYGQAIFEPSPHQQLSPPSQHQQQQSSPQQQQQQQQQYSNPQQGQYQSGFTGHLGNPQQQNPETISQLSHESPIIDSDQRSVTNIHLQGQTAQNSPAVSYPHPAQDTPGPSNPQSAAQAQTPQQQSMAPPAGGPPPARRSQDTEKGLRDPVQPPPGPPPSYRQSQQPNNMNPLPQPPNASGAPPNFRSSNVPDRQQFDGPGDIQGRNSPQPPPSDRGGEDPDKAFKDLLVKYKNVKRLYFDGKKEIEQLNGQVEQLQNAIANQRMSQSRTSLDDSEYATRFNRLNGAINNLSFNIRKDWVTLPQWLAPFVSVDALKTGKQEMTAVGRAVITRWLVDEIFNRCFHPGLDPELSRQLKMIEQNIRHFSYTLNSQEEWDALTSKVVSWRMTTLEGLKDVLRSAESANHKNDFTRRATTNLTASLFQHLTDPPPSGVDGSASMIVELAVGIASNLPLESRDVAITYPLPETPIHPDLMEIEKTGLPALEARPAEGADEGAGEESGKDGGKDGKARHGDKRGALLSALGAGGNNPGSRKGSVVDASQVIPPPPKDAAKVRFAGFVAVEVRGRQVLVKAPVWTLG